MQFSYNWIQDFFSEPLPDADTVATEVGLHMFELEGVEPIDDDTLIDWDILPNRSSDCMSYDGIAKEVAAICGTALRPDYLPVEYTGSGDFTTQDRLHFTLESEDVLRATKRYAEGVQVGPSPDWLRTRLESIGQKSINNVVDITNYVMWVTGQPVHAFDYDKLTPGVEGDIRDMSIRQATDGETVVDLSGAEHILDPSMMVVADAEHALDVAGIKGGDNSGVDQGTTRVVISACVYNFSAIRRTSRALKLRTDASARYENEVPLHKPVLAQALCAKLLEQECGARVASTYIDSYDLEMTPRTVVVPHEQIVSVLGIDMTPDQVVETLVRAHFNVEQQHDEYVVTIPLDRVDVSIAQDIIEEVGRLYGYSNVVARPIAEGFNIPEVHAVYTARDRVADVLVQLGFYETMSRTLTNSGVVELANPLSSEAGYMRSALLPFLQDKVAANFAYTDTPQFFEIGKVFTGTTDGVVDEHWSWAGILGRRKIKDKQRKDLFLETKGVIETVFDALHVAGVTWQPGEGDTIALLEIDGNVLGAVGVNWWEINFNELVAAIDTTTSYRKPSKYPRMDRDVAVWVPEAVTVAEVEAVIAGAGAEKCIKTDLFDIFEDKDNARKSLAFRMVFQCWDTTLTDEYVNGEMDKVYQALSAQDGFEIR